MQRLLLSFDVLMCLIDVSYFYFVLAALFDIPVPNDHSKSAQ